MNTCFVNFFPVFPVATGSSVVASSFFLSWPGKNKILYQLSNRKLLMNKYIRNIYIYKNNSFFKLIFLPKLIFLIFIYLKNKKKPILVIEGASWVGYSFIIFLTFRILIPRILIIYKGHSIEYEIRNQNSKFLGFVSKFFEKIIYNYSDINTVVSVNERNKIKKLYNVRSYLFPNSIFKKYLQYPKKKFFFDKYLLFPGSLDYKPNEIAVKKIINNIMPPLIKEFPNLKLVLTGGGVIKCNKKYLKNLGVLNRNDYLNILNQAVAVLVPLTQGSGTRVKIIESLMMGVKILCNPFAIKGINYNKKIQPPYICNSYLDFIKTIKLIIKKKISKDKKDYLTLNYYNKKFSMELNTKKFIKYHEKLI
jgi:hypothetical protein